MSISALFSNDPEKRFKVLQNNDTLSISFRWLNIGHILLAFFCLFWDGFLVVWYSLAFFTEAGEAGLIMILFPLIHVAVGIGITYYAICGFVNKTYITIDREKIKVVHKPLPWFKGDVEVDVANVVQLFVQEKLSRSKNGTSRSYTLNYISREGRSEKLIGSSILPSPEWARFLEDAIQDFLQIENIPITGEYGGRIATPTKIDGDKAPTFPKKLNEALDSTKITPFNLEKGFLVDYNDQSWEVTDELQFDWKGGFSHKQYTLMSAKNQAVLYVSHEPGFRHTFIEQPESPLRWDSSLERQLKDRGIAPLIIERAGMKFFRERNYSGYRFILSQNNSKPYPLNMWLYENDTKTEALRIEFYDDFDMRGFVSKHLKPHEISNILPK